VNRQRWIHPWPRGGEKFERRSINKVIVTEKGKYRLLKDIKTHTSYSVATIPKGTIIEITQIDKSHHKVIGNPLMGWVHWNLPVEPAEKGG